MAISGLGIAYTLGGFVLLWSGLKNMQPQEVVKDLLSANGPGLMHPQTKLFNSAPPTIGVNSSSSDSPSSSTPSGNGPFNGSTAGMSNPFRNVASLAGERIDMGVDYSGSGPVYSLGPGTVTNTTNAGWPGGSFICVHLTGGACSGSYFYVAEDIHPSVSVGESVTTSTVLGLMFNGGDGIEIGWAAPPGNGTTLAAANNEQAKTGDAGSVSTAAGKNMNSLLVALGAPGGVLQ